ncbi:hypothetical protein BDN72DRAFT_794538 [Pluteus cervinus]|uniref:Uncharacterized protein n=1 Tax=Pluteus cervinus TaxID=181527 RepID=A0ACD3AZ33_9AGAR|nr:hypothetical protein BDN72DRAFT_794538 [Pluteus cervinus]
MSRSQDQAESRVLLPGFGLPLNLDAAKNNKLFPTILDEPSPYMPLTTLREFTMMNLMNQLTDKPDWAVKVNNPEIASKWREEALSTPNVDITERMVEYCISELQHKAQLLQQYNAISVFHGDVVKSDTIVPDFLRLALIEAVRPLEDVPPKYQDWHPRSDDKVLDLVHPSLFPLLYGCSRVLLNERTTLDDCIEKCGEGEVVPVPPEPPYAKVGWHPVHKPFSLAFQWLPCEVDISNGDTKITSYINNLHPRYKELYGLIEQVISYAIPLWNVTLSPSRAGYNLRIWYTSCQYDPDPENGPATDGPQQLEGEDENTYWYRRDDWYEQTRKVVQPEPAGFMPEPQELPVDLRNEFAQTGLQVIVKLANIVLTPDKPNYEGGTWHVEGQLNEHICATALYYYDNDNVTASHLAFRQRVNDQDADDVDYEQHHNDWLPEVFGCTNWSSTVQDVGKIETKQGRLLTFPNLLQHQVQPFRLLDPTKPGHRKILALFLVDPNVKIISTANVPCQRIDWWKEAIQNGPERFKIPIELQDRILDEVKGFPLSMEEAKRLRLQLMDERSAFQTSQDEVFQRDHFSLCEH